MIFSKLLQQVLLVGITGLLIISCRQINDNRELLASQQNAPTTPTGCRAVHHMKGTTQVCGQPQRVVVLGPYLLEPLLTLGIQPVGFADHIAFFQGDYTDPSQQIPYLGHRITQPLLNMGLAYNPSIEAILKAKPDLIIANDSNQEIYGILTKIAPTLVLKFSEPEKNLKAIAAAVNRSEQVSYLLRRAEEQRTTAREMFSPLVSTHPKVMLLSSHQWPDISLSDDRYGLCHSLLQDLGFQLISLPESEKNKSDPGVKISLESLPKMDEADLIILLGANFSPLDQNQGMNTFSEHQLAHLQESWQKNVITQSLKASKNQRVYFIPAYPCLGFPGSIGTQLYLEELQNELL